MTNLSFKEQIINTELNSSRIDKIPDWLTGFIDSKIEKRNSVVLNSVDNFQNIVNNLVLNKPSRLEALNKLIKNNLKTISVPWIISKNWKLLNTANLDYKTSLFLLKKFWFYSSENKVKYKHRWVDIVENELKLWYSSWKPLTLIDFWEENEKFSFKNLSVWIISESNATHSLSHNIYLYASILKNIDDKEKEQLERFLNFIDLSTVNKDEIYMSKFDNFDLYNNSYKTIFWLAKYMKIKDIYKYFKNPKNTWFEIMTDDELKQNWLYSLSVKVFNNITQSFLDFKNRNEKKSLFTWDIEFILDIDSEIYNCLEICSSLWKWVIKVTTNWDVIVNSPVKFNTGSNIWIFERKDKNYLANIEKLLSIFKWDDAKYFFLRKIWYKWQLYRSLTPDKKIWEDHKNKKDKEIVELKRLARNDIKEYYYKNQILTEEDIFIWKEFYCKVPYLFNGKQTEVNVELTDSDEYLFYISSRTVKNSAQYNIERWAEFNDIHKFKIINIEDCNDRWYTKKVKLKQI